MKDKLYWLYQFNEMMFGLSVLFTIHNIWNLVAVFLFYNNSITLVQMLRKQGQIVIPLMFWLLPKTKRNKFLENM